MLQPTYLTPSTVPVTPKGVLTISFNYSISLRFSSHKQERKQQDNVFLEHLETERCQVLLSSEICDLFCLLAQHALTTMLTCMSPAGTVCTFAHTLAEVFLPGITPDRHATPALSAALRTLLGNGDYQESPGA